MRRGGNMIRSSALSRVRYHNVSLRSSYVEISKFVHTQRHGHPLYATRSFDKSARTFSSCTRLMQIEPDAKLREVLESYKKTLSPAPWLKHITGKQLNDSSPEKKIFIDGYLGPRRDQSKSLSFCMLRDEDLEYCVQVVSSAKDGDDAAKINAHSVLRSLKEWTPVRVTGFVKERPPAKEDVVSGFTMIKTREIHLTSIQPLAEIADELIVKDDTVFPPDQRHLQLRTTMELRKSLIFRSKAYQVAREYLKKHRWSEVETPMLFKSTPEGAREFLVPTRTKGLAYALPQSPQQYKQILMASGIPRYYQFARCFRDEDLRADRQPEFTQLDMECSFHEVDSLKETIESLLRYIFTSRELWGKDHEVEIAKPFPRMTYQAAMATYGSDKPDLRFDWKIQDITSNLPADSISKMTNLSNPIIEAFILRQASSSDPDPAKSRALISSFMDSPEGKPYLENPSGAPAFQFCDVRKPASGLMDLGHEFAMVPPEGFQDIDHGDIIVLQARKNEPFSGGSTTLGNLRLALHKHAVAQNLVPKPTGFKFLWVEDFPLFSPSSESEPGQGGSAGLASTHHPFTAPKTPEDVELLLSSPEKAIAAHYDIVLNGVEIGGGSRRIHDAAVQEFIFRDILKMRPERIEDFRHLLEVLKSGCPPHGGIALGWDRLMAVLLDKESVRDVIAFPKSGKGEDLLVKSPNPMTESQLDTYHLRLKDE